MARAEKVVKTKLLYCKGNENKVFIKLTFKALALEPHSLCEKRRKTIKVHQIRMFEDVQNDGLVPATLCLQAVDLILMDKITERPWKQFRRDIDDTASTSKNLKELKQKPPEEYVKHITPEINNVMAKSVVFVSGFRTRN
ncbi:hypothetical protein RUM44_001352 [Polyplax serrata]|uniref:Uncharacterized protein n=1 Tax=Polyplax serrata TaxID=468196 RepID=A0ABR1AJV1_POLSC